MNVWRYRIRVALALVALGVLGTSLVFARLHRENKDSILDVIRTDLRAGDEARAELQLAVAEKHFRRMADLTTPAAAGDSYDSEIHARALTRLGEVLVDAGRVLDAEACYQQALAATNPAGKPYDESAVSPLVHLRDLYAAADDLSRPAAMRDAIDSIVVRVEPSHLRAIADQRNPEKGDSTALADELMKLANLYDACGEAERSGPLYAEAFAVRSRLRTAHGGGALAPLLRLGASRAAAGDEAGAEEILKETLATREAQYGAKSPRLISNLRDLGMLAYRRGRLVEADSLLSRALAIEEDRLGPNPPMSAPLLAALADCSCDRGRFLSARVYRTRANEIQQQVYGSDSRIVGAGLLALAEIEGAAGERLRAREICERALQVTVRSSREFDPQAMACQSALKRLSRYVREPRIVVGAANHAS